ncbi:hypothetical protein Acr_17g0004040 [Actinidia rufa]|uniref:NB-ARC domain-containing disease resistance protein n=1 Tax=Actinidia rufa TaxID=165716 RepID=A0A7J0G233_9ERIC|nr:hypothetical protein Acr_17g0004040 [Actinidia rufa]
MAEKMIGDIARQINHFSGQDEKMHTLRKIFKTLSCQAADVKEIVEAEELRSGKKRKRGVDNWLGNVEMMENETMREKGQQNCHETLTGENRVLILDDVWNKIPLDKVGIPNKVNGRKTCKLILTTRSLDICRWIGCQAKFKVQPLSEEEAWQLFEEKLGQQTDLSPEVRDIAMSVAAKCSGLPLAIITMGGSMREVNDIQEWRNVLKQLEELTMGQEYMANEVHPILEFSYSRLNDMKLKLCFLCCALHPEDQKIERDELIGYFIAEGLIDEGKPWQAKFDEGHSMLNTLLRSYLLESCENDGGRCVKMHDLIREMALKITKEVHPRFMVKAGVGLEDIPAEREWTEDLDKNLENLTALMLQGCQRLIYVPPLGKLRALQELNFNYTGIKELPQGVDRLVNPKNLNLEGTFQLKRLPSGILGKLSHLQRLRLSTLGPVEVQAKELEGLRELKEIAVRLLDIDGFKQFVKCLQQPRFGGQLDKYFLSVKDRESDIMRDGNDPDINKDAVSPMASHACTMIFFPSLCGNATLLKECELSFCDGIESIISSSTSSYSSTSFQSLEKLDLYGLPDFVSLFRSKFLGFAVIAPSCGTFSNLKNLSVSNCPKIKSLFTSILMLLFRTLEVITVVQCAQIKDIIETVNEDGLETSFFRNHDIPAITLPKLKKICLDDLPELKSIFEGRMVCESIDQIVVHGCPKLRRLPFSLPLVNRQLFAPTNIYTDREWWESLEWDHLNAKDALRPYLY